jgi:hypothetical protein
MKPLLFVLVVISASSACLAQSWKPYVANANCIYGYKQQADQTKLISIRYDSVYTSGGNEIAFAYTRSYDNDPCLNNAHQNYRFDPFVTYPYERVSPFPIEIKQTSDSIISSTYMLPAYPHKAQAWNGRESDSVMNILGIPDSVKIYSLPDMSRIVLSKHFGIVQLGGYVLLGFKTDTLALGLRIPKIETLFRLAPGDILYYREMRDTSSSPVSGIPRLYADTRDSIVSVSQSGNKLNIGLNRQYQNYFKPALSYNDQMVESKYDLDELNGVFQEGAPLQRYDESRFYIKRNTIMSMETQDTIFSIDLSEQGGFSNDCMFGSVFDICASVLLSSNLLTVGYSSCNAIYGGGSETTLIGSRIGNKTTGHINLALPDQQEELTKLSVYPNPVTDILTLNITQETDYTIFDILGNKYIEGRTRDIIPVQTLSPGIYLLMLKTNDSVKTLRVTKH